MIEAVVSCPFCVPARVHDGEGREQELYDHGCHCMRVEGVRLAVGICCGKMLGAGLLAEEDFHDGMPWAKPEDCTCHGS